MGGSGSVSWLICLRTMHDKPTQLMDDELTLTVSQGSCLGQYITVQCCSALLAHARPTLFYIPLVLVTEVGKIPRADGAWHK